MVNALARPLDSDGPTVATFPHFSVFSRPVLFNIKSPVEQWHFGQVSFPYLVQFPVECLPHYYCLQVVYSSLPHSWAGSDSSSMGWTRMVNFPPRPLVTHGEMQALWLKEVAGASVIPQDLWSS